MNTMDAWLRDLAQHPSLRSECHNRSLPLGITYNLQHGPNVYRTDNDIGTVWVFAGGSCDRANLVIDGPARRVVPIWGEWYHFDRSEEHSMQFYYGTIGIIKG